MKSFSVLSALLFATLAFGSSSSQADEGCLSVKGRSFCCHDHISARLEGEIWSGVIEVVYSDGNAVIKWENDVSDTRVLADLPIIETVKCYGGVCKGKPVFAKFEGEYYEGEVITIFSDGSAKIRWNTGVQDVRVISEIPLVKKLMCSHGLCTGDVINAKFEGEYFEGEVKAIYSDGMAKVKWTTGVEDYRVLADLPLVDKMCDREHRGHCSHHGHEGHGQN